jgi:hypothetical protein
MAHLFSYLVCALVIAVVNVAVMAAILAMLRPLIERSESRARAAGFIAGLTGMFLAVWAYAAIAQHSPLDVSYLMTIIPGVLIIAHDRTRLAQARSGVVALGPVRSAGIEAGGISRAQHMAIEQASTPGHVFGLLIAMGFFLGGAPVL